MPEPAADPALLLVSAGGKQFAFHPDDREQLALLVRTLRPGASLSHDGDTLEVSLPERRAGWERFTRVDTGR